MAIGGDKIPNPDSRKVLYKTTHDTLTLENKHLVTKQQYSNFWKNKQSEYSDQKF